MKQRLILIIGLSVLLILGACNRDTTDQDPSGVVTPSPVKAEKVTATVTGDALRVRTGPYLNTEIVGRLMTGDRVVVESRTDWTETISGLNSYWFFVRADGYSGWTFGGFLDFGAADPLSVSRDPVLEPATSPVKTSGVSDQKDNTINPEELPEILLPVFGLEEPVRIENPAEGNISYDPFNEVLVLPISDSRESKLARFAEGSESGVLRIVAKTANAAGYNRSYKSGELQIYSGEGRPKRSAILVPFYRLATLKDGDWEIYAFLGDENWPVAVGKVDIPIAEVSLVPVPAPDPLKDSPRSHYRRGQTVYCFGQQKNGMEKLQLALYHDTGEYREGKILLKPVAAYQLAPDGSGKWSLEIRLDQQMPDGKFWIALGNPISGMKNLKLFVTSINL